jgi:hypothetical protein
MMPSLGSRSPAKCWNRHSLPARSHARRPGHDVERNRL